MTWRDIASLRLFDDLDLPITVLGHRADAVVASLVERFGPAEAEAQEPRARYAALPLTVPRGATVTVHLYAFDPQVDEARLWPHLLARAPALWLLIAAGSPRDDRSWRLFDRLNRELDAQQRSVRVAVLGEPDTWRAYGGAEPLASSEDALALYRALVKDALGTL